MTSIRVLTVALLVTIVAAAAPAAAIAEDDAAVTRYSLCEHLPWWPGCPQ